MALRLGDEPAWKNFLTAASIPDEIAAKYAKILVENRLTEATISQLTVEHLTAINITVVGDILAILGHIQTVLSSPALQAPHVESTTSTAAQFKPPPAAIKLPSVSSNMTHPQFRKFLIDWTVYKKITRLPT